jgi:5-dehydro-2-deoxygluconokinase
MSAPAYDSLHMGRSSIDLYSNRLGNACGAMVVTKQGCANFMPTAEELYVFVERNGGL